MCEVLVTLQLFTYLLYILSNKQNCNAFVNLLQSYNIATVGKDDIISIIELLCSATKSIITMRYDSRNCNQLPDLYVKCMFPVLQTLSVAAFNHRITHYDDQLELQRFQTSGRSNSSKVLVNVFKVALGIHNTEMRTLSNW